MFESTTTRPRAWRRGAGFTIIELMITVSVASILLAIAIPSFNQMMVSSRLVAQSNDVVSGLSLARSEAIKRNATVTVCRSTDGTSCATSTGNWLTWIVRASNGEIVRRADVNNFNGTIVIRSSLTTDQVAFGPDGLARTGGVMVADHQVRVCSTRAADRNVRRVVLGAGSRMSTISENGTCP
ncbi:MAG: GspH/FimT family pseudopilin [Steroidobacter sp.]